MVDRDYDNPAVYIANLEADEHRDEKMDYVVMEKDYTKLEAENQKLWDALKFYANESNWLDILDDVPAVFDDRGKIATKALEDE